jgi:hypothetical protein
LAITLLLTLVAEKLPIIITIFVTRVFVIRGFNDLISSPSHGLAVAATHSLLDWIL